MKKVFLVVIILYIAASLLKVHFFKIERYLSPGEGAQPFWTEAAIQYRYAKMVAEGEPIPELDRKLQYPEGIKPFSHLTIGMELVSGRLYRLLGLKIPFHIFIVYFVSFFSSLSIFSVALLSYQIWKNKFSCLISTFFYAFAIPAFFRTIGFFGREDFAMPFLFFGTFLFLKALDTEKDKKAKIIAFTSGVILALGISFWHVGRFYLSIFSIGILLFYILNIQSASSPVALLKFMLLPLLFFSIIIPVSRVNLLILSPGMIIIYAILLTDIFCKKKTKPLKNIAVLSTAALLVFLASFITYKIGEYSHVHSLIIDKIRFLGRKPSDPGMISYATRSMWIEAFLSPDPRILFHSFLLLFIPAIGSLSECISRFRKKIITKEIIFIIYFTAMYLLLYLLIRRISVLFCFFICVFAGGAVFLIKRYWRMRFIYIILLIALMATHLYAGINYPRGNFFTRIIYKVIPEDMTIANIVPSLTQDHVNIIRWIRRDTEPDEAFLTTIGTSPVILTYAGRPVLLHSKFETRKIREKVKDFVLSLYSTEDEFYNYCKSYDAAYFLHEPKLTLDKTTNSYRYKADSLILKRTTPAYLFQFSPEKLTHFELLYQNPSYRVYKIVGQKTPPVRNLPYQPTFDIKMYEEAVRGENFDDSNTLEVMKSITDAVTYYSNAVNAFYQGQTNIAIELLEKVLLMQPNLIKAHTMLGIFYAHRGDFDKALIECKKELQVAPYSPLAHYNLGFVYFKKQMYTQAMGELETTLALDPYFEDAQRVLKEIKNLHPELIK